jgi:transcriptional regulator with XRE-family HTH domain
MVDYKRVLTENMRRVRDELNLTQEDLAYEADIDRTYISGIERARRNPSLTLIVKLANELKTTPAALLTPAKK